ncbi:MAG: hypothetical protein U0795_26975 [Pirellulales bacterium]
MAYELNYVADGTGLNFLNGPTDIPAGQVLTVGTLKLVTKETILANRPGFAHFLSGPKPIWELWTDTPLAADVTFIDAVSLPGGGAQLGYAVPYPNDNVLLADAAVVAKAGHSVVRFIPNIA